MLRMPLPMLACCAAVAATVSAAYAQPLTFGDAIARAGVESPNVAAQDAAVLSARHAARAAGRLPDPQLVLGLENVPVDGPDAYRLGREPMTMQSIGVMQEMPSGAERRARRALASAETERADADLAIARLEARLGAAEAWLGLHYAERRIAVLAAMAREAHALASAARGRLAGGAGSIDDAIAAEIEAARIDDRREDADAEAVSARAALRRWVGDVADDPLGAPAPTFDIEPQRLRARLARHPELAAFDSDADMAEANLRLARAETAPDWSWSVMYGRRGEQFGDMASVEVRIGLPLFQGSRQRPIIEAQRQEVRRVVAERAAAERAYASVLDAQLAAHGAAQANLTRARDARLALARSRAEAIEGAFAAGAGSAEQMIVARREALEAELDVIDLEQRLALIGAALTLQYGEAP